MCPPQSAVAAGTPAQTAPPPVGAQPARELFADASWEALGTRVVLRLTDPCALGPARAAVEHELDAIDLACSRFRPDSDIARVNASGGRAVHISPLLADALALALRAAALTNGDVDPTVGSALLLAGYDRDWRLLDPPGERPRAEEPWPQTQPSVGTSFGEPGGREPIQTIAARAVCGWRNVMFDHTALTVRVPAGFTIDLGATAKAWAADRSAHVAALAGGCGALVGIGGDIAVSGPAPARGWAVHVTDDHRSAPSAPGQTVTIRSGGLATSSTAVRRWRHDGETMHHIIDPATGLPVRGTWRTVSVAAASCADANIATTSALVRASKAPAWLAGLGVPARLVSRAGRVYTIADWPAAGTSRQ
jgi:thiamine biosynthesis lipoprotein ApbE